MEMCVRLLVVGSGSGCVNRGLPAFNQIHPNFRSKFILIPPDLKPNKKPAPAGVQLYPWL